MIMNNTDVNSCINAIDLNSEDRHLVGELITIWRNKLTNNIKRNAYYSDRVGVKNIGIAVDDKYRSRIKTDIGWAAKAVDMVAERSIFDGFVCDDETLNPIIKKNDFAYSYELALTSVLIYSCGFWTVTAGDTAPVIRFYNAENGSAIWDWDKKQIKAGLVITDWEYSNNMYTPACVVVHKTNEIITLRKEKTSWHAYKQTHNIGRPLIEAMTNKPSDSRPFGKSVISKTVMAITDEMKREILRCSLHSELYTSPAKYVLGVANLSKETAEQVKRLFKTNEIFVAERDENGQIPQIGQLNAQSMTAHTEIMQNLAKRMSAEASIPLNSLGIIHDNPSSAEALKASMEDLIQKCEKLNRTNAKTLKNIARLTLAVNTLQPVDNITEEVDVCFKNPATVSMAAIADAMTKQANVIPWIAETDVFLESLGYSDSQRARLKKEKAKAEAESRMQASQVPALNNEN